MANWPENWTDIAKGTGCPICVAGRPESDAFGVRFYRGKFLDAYLQRAEVQSGYTVAMWRGRHAADLAHLTDEESIGYCLDLRRVAMALYNHYHPLILNYETWGNGLPHIHTHITPRYLNDPAPGRPFPRTHETPSEKVPEVDLLNDVEALKTHVERLPARADLLA